MLVVFPNSALDSVDKGLRLIRALIKEDLEFFPGDEDVDLIPYLPLVLLPVKQGNILEEDGGKWHPILTLCSGGGKMVLTLLKEVIVL